MVCTTASSVPAQPLYPLGLDLLCLEEDDGPSPAAIVEQSSCETQVVRQYPVGLYLDGIKVMMVAYIIYEDCSVCAALV